MMLRKIMRFNFSKTIALISGAPKYDLEVSKIASTFKEVSNNEVSIVGVIGDEHSQSFSDIYASSGLLDNYEFEVTRAYNSYHEDIQDCRVMPYRIYTHYRNYKLMKELEEQKFFD